MRCTVFQPRENLVSTQSSISAMLFCTSQRSPEGSGHARFEQQGLSTMHGAFQLFGSHPSLQSVFKSDLGQVISHFYPSAGPHSMAVLQTLTKHFWAMSAPARTWSHACNCHNAIDIDFMYPLESILGFFYWKLAFFWIWQTMGKALESACMSPKTQLCNGSSMLAYVRPISVYEFWKDKIKPSCINICCNGSPIPPIGDWEDCNSWKAH